MTLVVDASVAAKWVLPEPRSAQAVALRTEDADLIAPSLVLAEIGNALWKSVARGDLPTADVGDALRAVAGHFSRLAPLEDLAASALDLSVTLNHPIYDCFYIVLAERERAALVTADNRLMAAAKRVRGVKVRAL